LAFVRPTLVVMGRTFNLDLNVTTQRAHETE
jgi:hypothetical protein